MDQLGTLTTQAVTDFVAMLAKFSRTLSDIFDEDDHIKVVATQNEALRDNGTPEEKEAALRKWDADMKKKWGDVNYYTLVRKREHDIFAQKDDLEFAREFDLWTKWHDTYFQNEEASENNREVLWKFLDELNKYALFYCTMPKKMIDKVATTMQKYVQVKDGKYQLQSGLDLNGVAADLQEMMKDESLGQDEMTELVSNGMFLLKDFFGENNERLPELLAKTGMDIDPNTANNFINGVTSSLNANMVGGNGLADFDAMSLLQHVPPEFVSQIMDQFTSQQDGGATGQPLGQFAAMAQGLLGGAQQGEALDMNKVQSMMQGIDQATLMQSVSGMLANMQANSTPPKRVIKKKE